MAPRAVVLGLLILPVPYHQHKQMGYMLTL